MTTPTHPDAPSGPYKTYADYGPASGGDGGGGTRLIRIQSGSPRWLQMFRDWALALAATLFIVGAIVTAVFVGLGLNSVSDSLNDPAPTSQLNPVDNPGLPDICYVNPDTDARCQGGG